MASADERSTRICYLPETCPEVDVILVVMRGRLIN